MDEFKDVAFFAILRQGKEKATKEMVATNRLPVLQDTKEVDFESTYGIKGTRSWRVFNRSGCVSADSIGTRIDSTMSIEPVLAILRGADR